MSSDWKDIKFSELCIITRGASPRPIKDFMSHDGIPWVKIADATSSNSRFIESTKERIKIEGVAKSKKVYPGDLILSNSATPGLPKFMNIEACIHDGWMLLRDFKGLNKNFAYWLLLHERKNLVMQGNGSVFTNLKTDILKNHRVKVPNKGVQEKIAHILDSLQIKIELNTQTNQTLEQIAQALFKSWFVDFDPVKAKIGVLEAGGTAIDAELAAMSIISAKSPEQLAELKQSNPDTYQQLTQTAALFPSAMQKSELGDIPEGWGVSSIEQSFKVVMGQSPKGETYNEDGEGALFYQGRAEFGWRFPSPRLYTTDPKRMANKSDVLMSIRAPVGDLNIALDDCCVGRGLCSLRHGSGSTTFTYYLLKQLQSKLNTFNGEGTVFGSINQKDLKSIQYISPENKIIRAYRVIAEPLDDEIEILSVENNILSSVRDSLLPRLLSGELLVPTLPRGNAYGAINNG